MLRGLQKILNAAARLICLVSKFDNASPNIKDLHLPVELPVEFKVLVLVFKELNGMALRYLCDLIRNKTSTRRPWRSNDLNSFEVPGNNTRPSLVFAGPFKVE